MDFLAHPMFAIGLPHGSDWIYLFAFFLLYPLLVIGALVSCLRHESSTGNTKVAWLLVIFLLHGFGPLAYLLIRRPRRIRDLGR